MKKILLILYALCISNNIILLSMDEQKGKFNNDELLADAIIQSIDQLAEEVSDIDNKIINRLLISFNKDKVDIFLKLLTRINTDDAKSIKQLFRKSLMEIYGSKLKSMFKPGLSSLVAGADFGVTKFNLDDNDHIYEAKFYANDSKIVVETDWENSINDINFFDLNGQEIAPPILGTNYQEGIHLFSFNGKDKALVEVAAQDQVYLLDANNQIITKLKLTKDNIEGINLSPCGNYLACASESNEIVIWDIKNNKEKYNLSDEFQTQGDDVSYPKLSFDPTSRYLAIGISRHAVTVFDLQSINKTKIVIRDCFSDNADAAANDCDMKFSHDGKYLLYLSARNQISVWDLQNKKNRKFDYPTLENITTIAVSPDNQYLVFGDGEINFCDITTGELIAKLDHGLKCGLAMTKIIFNSDGTKILFGGGDWVSHEYGTCNLLNVPNDLWIIPKLSLTQLVLITKLITSKKIVSEIDALNKREIKQIFYKLPKQVIRDIRKALLPKLIKMTTKINIGNQHDFGNLILEY